MVRRVDAGAQATMAVEEGRGNASRLMAVHSRQSSYSRMRVQAVIGHSSGPASRRRAGADRQVVGTRHVAVRHAVGIAPIANPPLPSAMVAGPLAMPALMSRVRTHRISASCSIDASA
jgi:hypothetical protein